MIGTNCQGYENEKSFFRQLVLRTNILSNYTEVLLTNVKIIEVAMLLQTQADDWK